jgi:tellurite resistance protein TehA-like permease
MSFCRPPEAQESPIANLHPASFAMVMATGIVSVAAQLRGMSAIAMVLLWLNVVLYIILWLLTIARLAWYGAKFLSDLFDHGRCVGFFTVVAATCVLGNQFVVVTHQPRIAICLWFAGTLFWAIITYTVFTILTVKREKPSLGEGLNGGWLVAVVAAQSVAALGGLLATSFDSSRELIIFFSLAMWLGGGMLYIWIIALIFYRYTFFPIDARQLAPPYWINMGAMAISTLAGTVLVGQASDSELLSGLLPFLKGLTLMFWATATWWIPLLVALGVWRHVLRKVPLTYDVVYWSAVFPIGMYTACTHRLVESMDLPFLDIIPRYCVFVALAAWALTLFGFLWRLVRLPTNEA